MKQMYDHDFPKGVAKPAQRALLQAGYCKLEQLNGASEAGVLSLHGMGPKAMKLIKQALAEKGMSLAD